MASGDAGVVLDQGNVGKKLKIPTNGKVEGSVALGGPRGEESA
jgi:hypothetical protein